MCLLNNSKETAKFLKKNCGKDEVVVWKIYYACNGDVESPFFYERPTPGVIQSSRQQKGYDVLDRGKEVNRGIHVFLTREPARLFARERWNLKVFRCTAKVEDFVAAGSFDGVEKYGISAVFMKIHISKKEFARGKKGRN